MVAAIKFSNGKGVRVDASPAATSETANAGPTAMATVGVNDVSWCWVAAR